MPDLVVHNSMGDHVLKRLPQEITAEIDSDAFHVGVLGPDPYFFYRFFILPLSNGVDKRGKTMHHSKCGAFLMELGRRCAAPKTDAAAEVETAPVNSSGPDAHARTAFSYFTGFLCHYALDSTAHPYINMLAAKRPGMHTAVERKLDNIELRRQHKQPKDIMRLFVPFPALPEIRQAMKAVYGWDDDLFRTGYRHMKIFLWFIKDQHGLLAKITAATADFIAKITGQNPGFIRAVSYRNHMADDLDVGDFDRYEREAVDFAVELITSAEDYRAGRISEQELAAIIGNRDYSGGDAKK